MSSRLAVASFVYNYKLVGRTPWALGGKSSIHPPRSSRYVDDDAYTSISAAGIAA